MIENYYPYLKEINLISIVVRILLAVLCGGVIGAERGRKGRPAGFRTHILVCLGASLAMLINQYIILEFESSDPARLGAQVISGIGFLGAGTIIVTGRNQVKGLTTAAGLWASACMGLAIGIGFYTAALVACFTIIIVCTVLHKVDIYMLAHSKVIVVYVEFGVAKDVSHFFEALKNEGMKVTEMELTKLNRTQKNGISLIATIRTEKKSAHSHVIELLSKLESVRFVEKI